MKAYQIAEKRLAANHSALVSMLFIGVSCSDQPWPRPASIPAQQFSSDFQEWREYRQSRLIAPGPGPVTWVGLWELHPGANALGTDSSLPIVLPRATAPRVAGTVLYETGITRFEPAADAAIRLADGTPVNAPLVLSSDRTEAATTLAIGALRLRVHGEPGTDRLWLRAWDEEHPDRATFKLPDSYPPDTAWRVSARFEPFEQPREYRVADITEGTQAYRSPGRLLFRLRGKQHRLAAFAEPNDTMFFVMMWDSTARSTTYQGGRYLRVPMPDTTGWTVIDFNRAYSPPCVFTAYSTCAFAPAENRLQLAVLAGEKRVK